MMSKTPKVYTTQIRPSVNIDTALILERIAKTKPIGTVLDELLRESPTYQKELQKLLDFKGE